MNRAHTGRLSFWFVATCFVLSSSALACTESWPATQDFVVRGEATTTSGEFLYEETLRYTTGQEGGELKVVYTDSSGETIAEKFVSYDCNPTTPSFKLIDYLSNTTEAVNWNDDNVEYFNGDSKTELAVPNGQSIVDAGFDNAIKLNWQSLIDGDSVRFNYLFGRKNRFLKLRFTKVTIPETPVLDATSDTVFFKISANNVFFRMFSDSIYVGYHSMTRQLQYYYGPPNLPSMSDQEVVVILYQ